MKILVFTDNHADLQSIHVAHEKAKEVDLIICLGDISWFEEGMEEMLEAMSTLPKPIILLHGNHERLDALKMAAQPYDNITVSHEEIIQIDDFDFLTFGGDGFSRINPEFESTRKVFTKHMRDPKKSILLLHGPPYDTTLDIPFADYHSGSISYREFIEDTQPLLVLCGHIHECEGNIDKLGETPVFNPGLYGEIINLNNLEENEKLVF